MENRMNRRIQELPQEVADKIAAGEVIDRPLSIVKELVENAVDSGADSIVIEFRNGGKTYIRVTDNGSGIDSCDVALAFKRHATSKIETAKDLESIQTLGFRGEALSSICAVSKTEVITKTSAGVAGFRILFSGSLILEKSEIGCPQGTTVIVTDLFFNTPARYKFMKPESTETTLIIDFVAKMALAYPCIKIRLINNGNILFSTSGKGDLFDNILMIFNTDLAKKLIHIEDIDHNFSIEAYISTPSFTQSSRKNQIVFVNGRTISNKIIDQAIAAAYREKIPENRYPAAFIFFHIPPSQLDVNIHPNKKEVRFEDEKAVLGFIERALLNGLSSKFAIPEVTGKSIFASSEKIMEVPLTEQINIKQLFAAKRESESSDKFSQINSDKNSDYEDDKFSYTCRKEEFHRDGKENLHRENLIMRDGINQTKSYAFDVLSLTVTGIIFDTYITAVDEDHFYLIDQHAAHERVFYEMLMSSYYNRPIGVQAIILPFTVHTSFSVSETSEIWLSLLRRMGYDLVIFGPKTYRVDGIPMFMDLDEAKLFLEDFLENISDHTNFEDRNNIEKIISKACRSAIKAHDKLSSQEVKQLLLDLSKTDKPGSCPHGRPVYIKLSKHEIEKLFKRI